MKIFVTLIGIVSAILNGHGQTRGWLYNANGDPIQYATVITLDNLKNGTTTGENGYFFLTETLKSGLYISAVGFYDTIIPTSAFIGEEIKIKLRTRIYTLDEVTVTPDYSKPIVIGLPNILPTSDDGWKRRIPGEQSGIFYKSRSRDKNKTITSVKLYIANKGCYDAPMGLRLLTHIPEQVKENKKVTANEVRDLLPELVKFQAECPGWLEIDLNKYNVTMPKNGLFVVVTALDYGKKYRWKDESGNYYGAMIANNPQAYPAFKLVLSDPDPKNNNVYYIIDSPLLRHSKPAVAIYLK